jgi:hypothetical protein
MPWRPIGLWDVEAPLFSIQWPTLTRRPLFTRISVRGLINLRAIARLEGSDENNLRNYNTEVIITVIVVSFKKNKMDRECSIIW